MLEVEKIRGEFPILERRVYDRPLVYLDNGATAQKPRCVIDTVDYLHRELNANIHRGVHFLSEEATERYEQARQRIAGFIGAAEKEEVVFTAGATASLNTVAYAWGGRFVHEGDNIVISEMEHHSNLVPWQMLAERCGAEIRVLPFDDEGRLMTERLAGLLDRRTKVVAVTQASNTLGTRPELRPIIDAAHAVGAVAVVDGCQGVVHGGVDVQALDCDFYAFSGHKLYGPTGIGVLYGKRALLEAMPPFLGGGDMVDRVSFARTTYAPVPLKFEAGTANFVGAIALGEAVKFVQHRGPRGGAAAPRHGAPLGHRGAAHLRHDGRQVRPRLVQRRGGSSLRHGDDSRQARHRRPYGTALRRAGDDPLRGDGHVPCVVRPLQYARRGRRAGRRRSPCRADAALSCRGGAERRADAAAGGCCAELRADARPSCGGC